MRSPITGAGSTKSIVLAEQWRRYARTRDREIRDQLILAYSPLVKFVAGRLAARLPSHVELAELVSYGLGGLIDAVERFDPGHGATFEAFAGMRIRGAIIDELRSADWVPRSVRDEARSIGRASTVLTARLRRIPTEAELAAELSLDAAQLDAALQRVARAHPVALDEPMGSGADGVQQTLMDRLPDTEGSDPGDRLSAAELREEIAEAIAQLPERERVVIGLRYLQELSLAEIGAILGLSESRISQIHSAALLQMRPAIQAPTSQSAAEGEQRVSGAGTPPQFPKRGSPPRHGRAPASYSDSRDDVT
jgi:RNA polymerase sigma factor FliA